MSLLLPFLLLLQFVFQLLPLFPLHGDILTLIVFLLFFMFRIMLLILVFSLFIFFCTCHRSFLRFLQFPLFTRSAREHVIQSNLATKRKNFFLIIRFQELGRSYNNTVHQTKLAQYTHFLLFNLNNLL